MVINICKEGNVGSVKESQGRASKELSQDRRDRGALGDTMVCLLSEGATVAIKADGDRAV